MLEACTKMISAILLSILGFFIIKKITKSEVKLLNRKTIIYLLGLCIMTVVLHRIQYTGTHTVTMFALQIIIYKEVFNIRMEESLIACGILMGLTFIGDLLTVMIFIR